MVESISLLFKKLIRIIFKQKNLIKLDPNFYKNSIHIGLAMINYDWNYFQLMINFGIKFNTQKLLQKVFILKYYKFL